MDEMFVDKKVFDVNYFKKGEAVSIQADGKRFDAIIIIIELDYIVVKYYDLEMFKYTAECIVSMSIKLEEVLNGNITIDKLSLCLECVQ